MMITYTSADFDMQRTAGYTLLATVAQDECALAIVDQARRLKALQTYDSALVPQAVENLLGRSFQHVKVSVFDSRYMFVPTEVFDDTYQQVYRRYLPDEGLVNFEVSTIASLGVNMLYQANRLDLAPFTARFPLLQAYPFIQVLLCSTAAFGTGADNPVVVLDITSSRMAICLFDQGKFIYGNDFETYSTADFTYYLLSVLEHVDWVNKKPHIYLSGDIALGDERHGLLSEYGWTTAFLDSGSLTGVAVPEELMQLKHRFLTLFGLVVCG
ncbi:DUF3822 family protein [Parapedobacter deserti]|uniref:DUF3822 family protein n=1 Tax=Parapedobacter deserti TaxID=1912957 RepID=A0ABV7JMF0_9SPHI